MEKQKEQDHPIKFYRKGQEYGYFSNFFPSPFKVHNQVYPTTQHYFQSKKFQGKQYQREVATAKTPKDAFDLGRSRQHPIRKDWQQTVSFTILQQKRSSFYENYDQELVVAQPFWFCCLALLSCSFVPFFFHIFYYSSLFSILSFLLFGHAHIESALNYRKQKFGQQGYFIQIFK